MKPVNRLGVASVLATALLAALAGPALADVSHPAHSEPGFAKHAVFVQTDNPSGNQVVAYHRASDGTLAEVAAYPTGGLGGILAGSVVDHLASQGSLALDQSAGLLVAVNAGSNSISVFAVHGDSLRLRQVLSSGGTFQSCHSTTFLLKASTPANSALAMPLTMALRNSRFCGSAATSSRSRGVS